MANYSNNIIGILELVCPSAAKMDISLCNEIYQKLLYAQRICAIQEVSIDSFVTALELIDAGMSQIQAFKIAFITTKRYDKDGRVRLDKYEQEYLAELIEESCNNQMVTMDGYPYTVDFIVDFAKDPAGFLSKVNSDRVIVRRNVAEQIGIIMQNLSPFAKRPQVKDLYAQLSKSLNALAKDENSIVRRTVAEFAACLDHDMVIALASDADIDVRYAMAVFAHEYEKIRIDYYDYVVVSVYCIDAYCHKLIKNYTELCRI